VYESLLAIHEAQVQSVTQQAPGLDAKELLEITFAKGGSSVLADLYLVCEQPSTAEARFAFGYGVVLQLLDDLQDVGDDLATGHETLFTRAARRGSLDDVAGRLAAFLDLVLLRNGRFDRAEHADRVDLIRRNCLALWAGSVAEHPGHFSRRFRRAVERQWPVSFRSYRRLRRRATARWKALFAIERADRRSPDRVPDAGSGSVGFRGDEGLGFLDSI
jgi:hypothetical protein